MGLVGTRLVLAVTLLLLLRTPAAAALVERELCYVLDAVLFLYGIVLTVLYCHLKVVTRRASRSRGDMEQKEQPVYAGLSGEDQEMYETLQLK